MVIGRVKGGKGVSGGDRGIGKLGSVGTAESTGVLPSLNKLAHIKGEAVARAGGEQAMRPRGEIQELSPAPGEEGKAAGTEGTLRLSMTRRRERPSRAATVKLPAPARGIGAGRAMEDSLGEEHTGQEMKESTPAGAVKIGGGGDVLKNDSGAVGKEKAAIGGEDAGGAMLHKL